MFLSINDFNFDTATLNTVIDKENITYISKFRLLLNVSQHINFCLILHNIYIDNFTIMSNVKLNL